MGASDGSLLGRRAELAIVDGALEALGARRGAVLAFSGEGGIGKTRLLDELASRAGAARGAGWRWRSRSDPRRSARCWPPRSRPPSATAR